MKKSTLALAVLCGFSAIVSAAPVGIASGQPTGTNYPMAADIAKVCSTHSSPISNVISNGSLDNIAKVYSDKSTQYAIVQADAAEYMRGLDPKMMERIQMVFPFFSTEMHIVAKDGSKISTLAELAGKRVVEGPEGSGTWVTVQVIKKLTGLTWIPIKASQTDGFNMVMNGEADAEFIVAGAPVKILSDNVGFKLLSMSHPKLDAFGLYTRALLPSGMYKSVPNVIPTYKVDNMLITYAFKNQYQAEITELVTCLVQNVAKMQISTGFHPKWRDVDPLDIDRIKWQSHPAAKSAINRAKQKS